MLLDRMLRVAEVVGVAVSDGEVWIDGEGPFEHTGGGVLEASAGERRWLFTRTELDVFLQEPTGLPFNLLVKKPWHWDARATVLPLALPILLAVPALLFGIVQRRSAPNRNFGLLLASAGAAVLFGLYFELEHFAANYYPAGPNAALVGWRLLLNVGWLGALAALCVLFARPRELLCFRNARSFVRSLWVMVLAVSAVSVAILLPYWGLVGNVWGT